MQPINREKIQRFTDQQRKRYIEQHPQSAKLAKQAQQHMLFGAPLHWMCDWSTPFQLHISQAKGCEIITMDGQTLIDFCLGDTAAMFGHAPDAVASALTHQLQFGFSTMLASQDSVAVARMLAQHFALPFWQFTLSATDANRFVLRWLRAITQKQTIVVFNGCYHGTVEDTLVDLVDGQSVQRKSLLGQVSDLTQTTRVVEFNDLNALEAALIQRDVACVLAEPVMTNVGMVLPQPDFWHEAQKMIKHYDSYLVMDETHTLSTGARGWCGAHALTPDALVIGKAIAGGLPAAVYGLSADIASAAVSAKSKATPGHSGIGTTLSGNMFTLAAMRATLTHLINEQTYMPMLQGADQLANQLRHSIQKHRLDWCVTQVGARVEFQFCPEAPQNGSQARAAMDDELEQVIHLAMLNEGILITPFHNMMLISPVTKKHHIDQMGISFDKVLDALCKL